MAVSMLATTSSTGKILNINTTLTLGHTVDAGTDVLVVIVGANDTTTADMDVTGVTWDAAGVNEALSWVVGAVDAGSATNEEVWHKIGPTAKSANITITFAAKTTAGNADALNLDGVDTGDPVAASQRTTGSMSDPDVQTGSAPDGCMTIGGTGISEADPSALSVSAGTELYEVDLGNTVCSSAYRSASDQLTWDHTTEDASWNAVAVTYNQSAAAPPGPISESETLSLSDTPAVKMADLTASESESLGLADASPVARVESYITKAESLGLSAMATLTLDALLVSVSETLGLSDTAAEALDDLAISESDSLGLDDATPTLEVGAEPDPTISKAESLTLSAVATVSIAALTVSVSESLNLDDATPTVEVEAEPPRTISVSDSLTLAASASAVMADLAASLSESLGLDDATPVVSVGAEPPRDLSVADSLGLAASATVQLSALAIAVSETLGLSSTATTGTPEAAARAISVSDNLGLADSAAASLPALVASVSDALGLSDSAVVSFEGGPIDISVSDSLTLSSGSIFLFVVTALLDVAMADSAVGRVAAVDALVGRVTLSDRAK